MWYADTELKTFIKMINYVVPPKFNPSEIVKEFRKIFEIHGDEFQKFVKKHLIIPSEDKARRTMFVQYISDHQVFLDEIENNEHRHTLPLKELVSNFYGCCNPYRTQAMRKMVGDNDYLKPTNLTLFDMYAYAILKNNSTKGHRYRRRCRRW